MTWVASTGFVGRLAEQGALADLLVRIAAADGGAVLLAGEAGIGKTRLAEEAAANAAADGLTVCWGRCRESAGAPPLWPWLQVLRQLGLRPIAPAQDADAAGRFRLFERVSARLAQAAGQAPVLIVFDDAHRADELSLRLLAFAADQLWPAPVGFLVAYRDTELDAGVAAPVLTELSANRRSRLLTVSGLAAADVELWVERERDDSSSALGTRIHERTGGNPLFVGEVIRLLATNDSELVPPTVRELIAQRIGGLPPATQELLEVAAVLGRDFGYAPLAAAVRTSPVSAIEALQPAVTRHLVSVDAVHPGGYRFNHVLVRETVLDGLPEPRRVHLHALALAALRDTGWALPSDLAEHALRAQAELGPQVVAALLADAADDAASLLAWEDAARWWELMVDTSLARVGGFDPDALRLRLGRALLSAGQVREARAQFEQLADRAQQAGDDALRAASALAVGDTVAEVAADAGLIRLLDLALTGAAVPPSDRVRLLARSAIASYWSSGGQDEARRRAAEAVEAGRAVGDDRALGEALVARQFSLRGPDALTDRIRAGEEIHVIAQRLGDDELRFRAHQWLIPDRFQAGDLGAVREELAAAAEIARARRDPLQRWWITIFDGLLAGFAGRDEQTERAAREVAALGRRLGQPAADVYAVAQLVPLFWRTGRLAELAGDLNPWWSGFLACRPSNAIKPCCWPRRGIAPQPSDRWNVCAATTSPCCPGTRSSSRAWRSWARRRSPSTTSLVQSRSWPPSAAFRRAT